MNGRIAAIGLSVLIVAGCQAPPAAGPVQPTGQPSVAPPAPVPAGPPATQAAAFERTGDTRADSAAKLAASQAKAIESMLAAKGQPSNGVTSVDPSAPANAAAAAGATPIKSTGGDDVFKPVPPPPGGGAAAIGSAVGFVPPPDAQLSAPPTGIQPAGVVMTQAPAVTQPPAALPDPPRAVAAGAEPLETQLQKAARETPSDLAPQLDAQLYRFLKGETVPSADAMAGLTSEDRDVLTAILDGLSNFRTNVRRDANLLIGQKIRPLTDMGDRLRSRADLIITNAALCRSIRAWGNYDPITPLRLPAGVDNWPGLYYEIENFSMRLDANNMWTALMRQDVAIYDQQGTLVWQWPNEKVSDICRNRRHDLFFAKKVPKPIKLPAGRYIVKISLTDSAAGRVAETSISLTMTPPAAVPQPPAGPPLR